MDKAFDDVCMMSILQSSKMFEGLSKEQIKQLILGKIEKITGKSEFKGKADETVFCGHWDTRL